MINIDLENNNKRIEIDGKVETLLTELIFVASFVYLKMRNITNIQGRVKEDPEEIKKLLIGAVLSGIEEGKKIEEKERGSRCNLDQDQIKSG